MFASTFVHLNMRSVTPAGVGCRSPSASCHVPVHGLRLCRSVQPNSCHPISRTRPTATLSVQSPDRAVVSAEDGRSNGESTIPTIERESGESILKEVSEMFLPRYSSEQGTMELVIAGAGPSGLAVAARVSQAGNVDGVCRYFNSNSGCKQHIVYDGCRCFAVEH